MSTILYVAKHVEQDFGISMSAQTMKNALKRSSLYLHFFFIQMSRHVLSLIKFINTRL